MATIRVLGNVSSAAHRQAATRSRRLLHRTSARAAITNFQMPAMSPTMTEGGIASWKKKEGEEFSVGDVLLEIETDKATIDVEAQDDGVMGKILLPEGSKNVPVGKTIALLAEEGDDITNLEAPKEDSVVQPASSPPPPTLERTTSQEPQSIQPVAHDGPPTSHTRPLFPSVHRLVLEHGITSLDAIKGTGVRGMLTKGDILTYLGKASGPNGTYKAPPSPIEEANKHTKPAGKEEFKPLEGLEIRRIIANSWLQASLKARNPPPSYPDIDFDSVVADYLPQKPKNASSNTDPLPPKSTKSTSQFLEGLV